MNKELLKECVYADKKIYKEKNSFLKRIYNRIINHIDLMILKMKIYSRKYNFYKKNNFIKAIYYGRKFFKYSSLTNCEIYSENIGKNCEIFHGGIVINKNAIIGNNVRFHGNNCVGNNGKDDKAPIIGNGVDIGFGSVIIGDVKIADGIIIGANSTVTKSFEEENLIIAGNPAKVIKKN